MIFPRFGQLALAVALILPVLSAARAQNLGEQACPAPTRLDYQLLHTLVRSKIGFTQGLFFQGDGLYESVGEYGGSKLNRIDPSSGAVETLLEDPKKVFGEGLVLVGDLIYQLTWKEHQILQYSLRTHELTSIAFPYNGWGMAMAEDGLGKLWITSDGTERLRSFRSGPVYGRTWRTDKIIRVKRRVNHVDEPEVGLNSLNFAQGILYANIFLTAVIDQIDLKTGCVRGVLDLATLVKDSGVDLNRDPEFVLNGIAYRRESQSFFVTGKNWPKIYELKIK
jgi:glutaminyl-peptide cyclotransferase